MPQASSGFSLSSSTQVGADVILTGNIKNGEIVNADISNSAAIALSKVTGAAASGANNDITSLGALSTLITVAQGGIGVGTLAAHGILIGNGTSAIVVLARGNSGQILQSGGANADPSWTASPNPTFFNGVTTRAGNTATGTQNIAHGYGSTPRKLKITVMYTEALGKVAKSFGVYNGTTMSCIYEVEQSASSDTDNSSGVVVWIQVASGGAQTASVTMDATNIILSWTYTPTVGSGPMDILWEVE